MPDFPNVEDLLVFLLRVAQDRKHQGPLVQVPSANSKEYLVLFGPIQRVRRLVHAYIKLRHLGMGPEGRTLARAALEYSVTAQWAYLIPGGVDRLWVTQAVTQREVAKTARQFEFGQSGEWDQLYQQIVADMPTGKALPPFSGTQGIMAELDSNSFLDLTYKLLSQTSHNSYDAATGHIVEEAGQIRLRLEPPDDLDHAVLYSLAGFGLLATWIQARLEDDTKEVRALEDFGQSLQIPYRLDAHLSPNRRRFTLDQ